MIRLSIPDIQESDIARAVEVLRSGNLVQAGEVSRFEQGPTDFIRVEHVTAVSSGTAALQTFMVTLDPKQDRDKVITALGEKDVPANLGAQAINCLSHYRVKYGWTPDGCPVAARLYSHGLLWPLHGRMVEAEVREVATALSAVLES